LRRARSSNELVDCWGAAETMPAARRGVRRRALICMVKVDSFESERKGLLLSVSWRLVEE
jgi:hypothetical protein